jgi:hypothetical protein
MKQSMRRQTHTEFQGSPPVLYSKPGCLLCRQAERAVATVFGRAQVPVVNILGDRELEDRYVFRIPVLALGELVLAEGRITIADARAARARVRGLVHPANEAG